MPYKDAEQRQKYDKEYRLKNRERDRCSCNKRVRDWCIKNPDRARVIAKKSYRNRIKKNPNLHKEWYAKHVEESRERGKRGNRERKLKVLSHYSNGTPVCKECGFSDDRALCIDHVNDNGAEERKTMSGSGIYAHIIRQGYPSSYQVLCANCNLIKEINRRMVKHDTL